MKKQQFNRSLCVVLSLLLAAAVCMLSGCSSDTATTQAGTYTADTLPSELAQPTLPTFPEGGAILPPDVFTDADELPDAVASEISEALKDTVEFTLEVTGEDGVTGSQIISTDRKTVGEALLEFGMIAEDENNPGMIITVLGETHRYEDGGKYWAFYIDGEYASTGMNETEIVPGAVYALRVE